MHWGELRLPRRLIALPLVLVLLAAGCGGGSTGNGTTSPTASAPEATAPPPDATQPGTDTVTTPPGVTDPSTSTDRTVPQDRGGGKGGRAGGGKRNVRVPATFLMTSAESVTPRTITVPPYIAIQLTMHVPDKFAQLGNHGLVVETPEERRLDVYYRQHVNTIRLPGQRPGRYRLMLDRRPVGTLIVGGEPGP